MHDRIRFITFEGKQILLVDCSNCSAHEVEQIARAAPEIITAQPRSSVLILTDFTGASIDTEALRAIKESAVFDKPHIKKSAWIGTEQLPSGFHKEITSFSGRDLPTFKMRNEGLTWLVAD